MEHLLQQNENLARSTLANLEVAFAIARPRLMRLASLRGISPAFLEDVVQESLLEAWRYQERLQAPELFDIWLDGICRNVCRRWQQRQIRRANLHVSLSQPLETGPDGDLQTFDLPDFSLVDPAEELNRQDLEFILDRALGHLSAENRQAIELSYLLELPQKEVALRLGLSISALEARLHRARRQLQQILAGTLRTEVEACGFFLGEKSTLGWRDSREWCRFCGRQRLRGIFQPMPDGTVELTLKCPDCSERLRNSNLKANLPAREWRSFRPAIKTAIQDHLDTVAHYQEGYAHCPRCGAHAPMQVMRLDAYWKRFVPGIETLSDDPELAQTAASPHLVQHCTTCAFHFISIASTHTDAHPAVQCFHKHHPRSVMSIPTNVEYQGLPAICHHYTDLTSSSRLTIFVHQQNLQILAISEQ